MLRSYYKHKNYNHKILEENIGETLTPRVGKNLVKRTKKGITKKGKKWKLNFIKIKTFCSSKELKKIKNQATVKERIFAVHIYGKVLMCRIYK